MASTFDITDKNGNTFRYQSISYWDKEKKKPRSKKEYLGKVDPVTGELIPKKARKPKDTEAAVSDLVPHESPVEAVQDDRVSFLEGQIRVLEEKIRILEQEKEELKKKLMELADSI